MNDSKNKGEKAGLDRSRHARENFPNADSTAIDSLLAQLAIASSTQKAPSSVRQRLQTEARLYSEALASRRLHPSGARRRVWSLAGAAALLAALLVAAGSLSDPSKLLSALHAAMLSVATRKDGHSAAAVHAADAQEEPASSPDTFAVPYSDPSIANGTGATVRVSLPDSELLAWGVPSRGGEPDDLVPVDLTLGDDGLPQAVRLLPATTTLPEETYP